jgi:NAD(P)H-dependent flavin oxidoreductase YrpB (nitropropane dioxygenase family)
MMISTRLTKFFDIEHPIILAPMTPAAGADLSTAVAAAGGLGLLGGGYGDRSWLEAESAKTTRRQRAWPEGYTGRLLKNEFIEKWHGQEEKRKVLRADELAKVEAASRVGDYDMANVTVGESIGMIHDLPRAGDVVRRVVDEAAERLAAGAASRRIHAPTTVE